MCHHLPVEILTLTLTVKFKPNAVAGIMPTPPLSVPPHKGDSSKMSTPATPNQHLSFTPGREARTATRRVRHLDDLIVGETSIDDFLDICHIPANDTHTRGVIAAHGLYHWSLFKEIPLEKLLNLGFLYGPAFLLKQGALNYPKISSEDQPPNKFKRFS